MSVEEQNDDGANDVQPSTEHFVQQPTRASSPCSPMQMDMTIAVDASPLLAAHSNVPSTADIDFQVWEDVEIVVKEGSDSQPMIPTFIQRYKWTTRRIVKHAAIWKSPFVAQLTQFSKTTHQKSLIVDFALAKDGDPIYLRLFSHTLFILNNFYST